jgi:hypothetical protein
LLRRIIRDVDTFNQMLKATANLRLMNEGIETFSKEGDPDVRRIPARMTMVDVKVGMPKWRKRTCSGRKFALKTRRR